MVTGAEWLNQIYMYFQHAEPFVTVYYLRAGVTKFSPGGPVSLQSLAPTLIKHTWSS